MPTPTEADARLLLAVAARAPRALRCDSPPPTFAVHDRTRQSWAPARSPRIPWKCHSSPAFGSGAVV